MARAQLEMNLVSLILQHATRVPERLALVIPAFHPVDGPVEREITFAGLARRIAAARAGLHRQGFKPGDRLILMAPLSIDLYALLLGIFASGLTGVFIDTGMGKKKVLQAVKDAKADAIVSVGALLKFRFLIPALWRLKKYSVDSTGIGLHRWEGLFSDTDTPAKADAMSPDTHALITFTSGSTGRPKGADRNHGLLMAQHLALKDHFPTVDTDVDMPCFPVVTLHNLCCGISTVLPAVDLGAPSTVDPALVLAQIARWSVTRMSGAPAYFERIVAHMETTGARAPGVRLLAAGGAPVSVDLCRRVGELWPTCHAEVIYGSTEAEPIASVSMAEVVAEATNADAWGLLVGRCAEVAEVALVSLPDEPPRLDARGIEPYRVVDGEAGELIVSGPHVNRGYIDNPAADRENKLLGENGVLWHRTGDIARKDSTGRLWLQGRVQDLVRHGELRVQPLAIEAAVGRVDGVIRAALVSLAGRNEATLAVEVNTSSPVVAPACKEVLKRFGLEDVHLVEQEVPMDYRHNSKVDRVTLRRQLAHL